MIYPIVLYGHPVLRKKTVGIDPEEFEPEPLISDMFETMYKANGIGLAAPQIGKALRLYIIDATPMADEFPELEGFKRVFINPEIIEKSDDLISVHEACLSIPEINEEVKRFAELKLRYLDVNMQVKEEHFIGFQAIVVQHEYDHLDGILFTDRLAPLRKRLLRSKLSSIAKGKVRPDYKHIIV
jgi:peptide deformylase